MKTQRTDIHRPSLLDPAEYIYLGCFYQGASVAMQRSYSRDMQDLENTIEANGYEGFEGNYTAKLTCDHCGAHFNHGACFLHIPTQQYISVGHICASDTIGLPSKAAAARRRAEKAQAEENERAKRQAATQGWRDANQDIVEFLNGIADQETAYRDGHTTRAPHSFLLDMVHSLNRYGSLTDGQVGATRKFAAKAAEFAARDAQRDADKVEPTTPVQTGRRVITGEIVTTKMQDSMYGSTLKMLVVETDGNKVWGTVPGSLEAPEGETLRGQRVRFTATVEQSDRDGHFGFFKRPTGATLITSVPPVQEVSR